MKIYQVWEIIHDYPENGGGQYLCGTYLTREKAEARKRELEEKIPEDEDYEEEDITYKVDVVEAL